MTEAWNGHLEKIDDCRWRIPKETQPGMRVDGIIYTNEKLLEDIKRDKAPQQVANVAHLPGIVGQSMAMPDIHWGYGFPIGGVAATDIAQGGVIAPGGIGFDINCGIRLMRTNLAQKQVSPKIKELIATLFNKVPCGVGSHGDIKINRKETRKLLIKGAGWAVEKGLGVPDDLKYTEDNGYLDGADPDAVSDRAYDRGRNQSGTLGSGNHFLEVQIVDEVYDSGLADIFNLKSGQITVMIHSGSRGLGYQVCDDYCRSMVQTARKYGIEVPDKQLACAPVNSPEGKAYIAAMKCAANYAWANRQCLMHLTREVFEKVFNMGPKDLGMDLIYDVAHNIAKFEKYTVDGKEKTLCVHRKGATRAFGPGHDTLPLKFRQTGQPVIIPGDMGTCSYLLVGTKGAEEQTFGSTCHGAGRVMSRSAAIRATKGRSIYREMEDKGITVMAKGRSTLAEEVSEAYKDINQVVDVVCRAGLSKKVCRMRPLGVIKG